jgi:hypothetical protein
MKMTFHTETVIEELVTATCGKDASIRDKHVYREALRGLVRLAKSEQLREMKANVDKLAGAYMARTARRYAKAILRAQRDTALSMPGQRQFEFNQR